MATYSMLKMTRLSLAKHIGIRWIAVMSYGLISYAYSLNFHLPPAGTHLVGQLQWVQALPKDTFTEIGVRYDVGYYQLVDANPGLEDVPLKEGTIIVIPTQFILPSVPRRGIVINLAELRLYHYWGAQVYTYPIGIGRAGWDTPLGPSRIIQKLKNPTWYVPATIRDAAAKEGVILTDKVPPGSDNPLGKYALRLEQASYLIHSTKDSRGVGSRSSAGCLRMYPKDAKQLFKQVTTRTRVNIINKPYKVSWGGINGKELYLEAHVPLESVSEDPLELEKGAYNIIQPTIKSQKILLAKEAISRIIKEKSGIPQRIDHNAL